MSSGEKSITENYEQLMINCLQVKVWSFFFFTYLFNFFVVYRLHYWGHCEYLDSLCWTSYLNCGIEAFWS